MFWDLGSKLKEAVIQQAAQLQVQAAETAKQYMASRQRNSDDDENQDEAEEVPFENQYPTQSSLYEPPSTQIETQGIIKKDTSLTPEKIVKSPQTTGPTQKEQLATFFTSFSKIQTPESSKTRTSPTKQAQEESRPVPTIIKTDPGVSIQKQMTHQPNVQESVSQIHELQQKLQESQRTNASLKQEMAKNNMAIERITKQLQILPLTERETISSSTVGNNEHESATGLEARIVSLESQIECERVAAQEELESITNEMVQSHKQTLQQIETSYKAKLQQQQQYIQQQIDRSLEEKQGFKQLNDELINRLMDDHKIKITEIQNQAKKQSQKTVALALQQVVKRMGLSPVTKLTSIDASIDTLVASFQDAFAESFSKCGDDSITLAMETIWNECSERFKDLQEYQKKSRHESNQWMSQRSIGDEKQREKFAPQIKLFSNQIYTLFQVSNCLLADRQKTEDLRSVNDTLQFQIKKLQNSVGQSATLNQKSTELQQKIENLDYEKSQLQTKTKDALSEKQASQLRLQEQNEKVQILITENNGFKAKLTELEDLNKRLKLQIQQHKSQAQQITQQDEKIKMYQESITQLTKQIKGRDSELFQLQSTITNQQRVLQSLQDEVQKNQDDHKNKVRKLELQINQNQIQVLEANQSVVKLHSFELQLQANKVENESLLEQLQNTKQMLIEVKDKSDDLIKQVKKDQSSKEFMIDRRLINTFLVQYASPKSNNSTKMKMLDAMSKMLQFNEQEKLELGLVQPERQKMRESLVNFLLGDSDL